jgi:GT2 family glycosyltransferase
MSKIGIGIITCDRPDFFIKCRQSIKPEWYSDIVVVNDGETPLEDIALAPVLKTNGGEGVGKAKNKAIKHLLKKECEYIILIEDDMLFKGDLFKQYIKAYQKTGIHHFMFAYHGPANKAGISGGRPVPRKVIDYGDIKIALNQHCVGAVCFYTKECLDKVGLYDETYTNAFEHVDHSYELAKADYSTPYWWWADIENSLDYVEEQACSENSSAIRPRPDWQSNIQKSAIRFTEKHGVSPVHVDDTPVDEVINKLKKIKNENRPVLPE